MAFKKSSSTHIEAGIAYACPITPEDVFAPIYCAEHFFSGPWPCACHPGPQIQTLTATADEISSGGSRGPGKTIILMACMIKGNQGFKTLNPKSAGCDVTYVAHPNYRGLLLIEQASDLGYMLDRAEAMYEPTGAEIKRGSNPPEAVWPSGAKIIFGYFGEDGWKKYLGPEFQRVGIDQMEKLAKRETHDRIMGSCRSRWPEMKAQAFSTWNPGGGDDLRGAPGQGWIMDYFMVESYLNGKYPKGAVIRHPSGKTTTFIPSKVTDNPYYRWKITKSPEGELLQVMGWKCRTCGKMTESVDHPEECSNRACPTNRVAA